MYSDRREIVVEGIFLAGLVGMINRSESFKPDRIPVYSAYFRLSTNNIHLSLTPLRVCVRFNGMRVYDVSVVLNDRAITYPGDPGFRRDIEKSQSQGDPCEVSRFTMGSHSGTHVDAPCHFLAGGLTLDSLPLAAFLGPCVVVDARGRAFVDASFVTRAVPATARRVLFKTDNGRLWREDGFRDDYCYISADGAQELARRRLQIVGWDYLSVERYDDGEAPAHGSLLASGAVILEGLNLSAVPEGEYFLVALPLAVEGADGSPVRAVLLEGVYGETKD